MSAPAKKAAEAAAKSASKIAKAAAAAGPPADPRYEMPLPAGKSTTETMMPWNGWFSNFLKDKLGADKYERLRELVLYRPNDVHSLHQAPNPSTKVPISKDGKTTAQFRYPSPGSQPPVRQPDADVGTQYEDPYNVSYYTRDTGRRETGDPAFPRPELEKLKLDLLPQDDPRVKEMKERYAEGAKSSPGNKGMFATGKSDFDPKGLRATMSANHAALNESLDANKPDHLPTPVWWSKQDEVVAWHDERDLPVPLGATGDWGSVPREGRIAKW